MKLLALCLFSGVAWAAPCTTIANCTEWLVFAGGPARSMIYRSYPLDIANPQVMRALIVIHGAGRDADNYFRTAVAAAFLADALDDTIVIAPRLASNSGSCRDPLGPYEVSWSCAGDSWRSGGTATNTTSTNNEKLTSFDFTDEILRKLARKD